MTGLLAAGELSGLTREQRALLFERLRRKKERSAAADRIPRRPPDLDWLPLSFAQERLWFIDRLEPGLTVYNLVLPLRLEGEFSPAVLAASLGEVVRRHEALRTTFDEIAGRPVQVVAAAGGPWQQPLVDLSDLPKAARAAEARRLIRDEAERPFDLVRGPLLRATLLRLDAAAHIQLLDLHHIVADGWSFGVLLGEMKALFGAILADAPSPLTELPIQYADFALWQRQRLQGETLRTQIDYWRERLSGLPTSLDLPTDRPRSTAPSYRGSRLRVVWDSQLARELVQLARRYEASLYMVLLAGFQALLGRLSGQEDLAVGSPIANRHRPEVEPLIGFFVNTLVLRGDLSGDPSFAELLGRVRRTTLEAFANQDLPFERLVEELRPERHRALHPLFQVGFAVQNAPLGRMELPGLSLEPLEPERATALFDLDLDVWDQDGAPVVFFTHNSQLFDRATVRRIAGHLEALLREAVDNPHLRLSTLPLLGTAQRHQLLAEWNDTAAELPSEDLASLFTQQARHRPDAVAISSSAGDLTYAELDRRTSRLARRLAAAGVGPEVRVALLARRSLAAVVGILAIVKAGGVYVPLDPSSPAERLAWLLADCGASVLLVEPGLLPAGVVVPATIELSADPPEVDGPDPVVPFAEGLAYIMYTSGSTGRPKGVGVTHRNIVRLVRQCGFADLGLDQVFLQLSPISFDASTLELWGALLNGGRLAIPPPLQPSLEELGEAIASFGVTILCLTSALFSQMVDNCLHALRPLRQLLAGGDVVSPPHARRAPAGLPETTLINAYGPTEMTTLTCCFQVTGAEASGVTVPIGRPIGNTRVFVLGPDLRPVPYGVWGELCAGGDGVSRGYLGNPDLTAERFVPDPFAGPGGAGSRLYRTGDIVRMRPDGLLEFRGRRDGQIKLRGFRIELGEIESALARHPEVGEAVVAARDAGNSAGRRLIAYVVPRLAEPGEAAADREQRLVSELRRSLASELPDYMLPAAFVLLEALPLTPHGKVDRAALPEPQRPAAAETWIAPATLLEELLAEVAAEVLSVERVGMGDNFFALGGHSLLATQLVSRLHSSLEVELPLRIVFEHPTLRELAAAIEALRSKTELGMETREILRQPGLSAIPLSFAQERLWFLDRLQPGSPAYNIPLALALRGTLDPAALEMALTEVQRRHEALRTVFREIDRQPVQVILPAQRQALPIVDLSALPATLRSPAARDLAYEEGLQPFDLEQGPLLRATLLRLAPDDHGLLLNVHHIAFDGWSMGVLTKELGDLYTAGREGAPSPLPELSIQYPDFAVWQRGWLQGEALERQLGYWRERLAGAPALDLPTDRPRPSVQSFRGGALRDTVGPRTAQALKACARRHDATPFMLLLAALQLLLGRFAGQEDVVLGSPIANRTRAEIEPLIGFFVNSLVLRGDLSGDPSFAELMARARRSALEAYSHQDLPFERLVEELRPERRLSHNPLFQVMFAVQNAPLPTLELPGLTLSPVDFAFPATRFDLELFFTEAGGGFATLFVWSTDLFDAATVHRLRRQLDTLLAAVIAGPARRISEIPLLPAAESHQVLAEWNDTAAEIPGEDVAALFARQARLRPEAVAVSSEGGDLTYAELDRRAGRLARRLAAAGVGPEVRVALLAQRSPALIVGVLGILKAGGVYVPLDPSYPAERLAWMLSDSAAEVLLGQPELLAELPAEIALPDVVELVADPPEVEGPDPAGPLPGGLAYVMYTSGSTGRPKGVGITHRNIVRLVRESGFADLSPRQVFLHLAPISFDASTLELWAPLLNGSRVAVFPARRPSLEELGEAISRFGVTSLWLTAGLFHQMVENRLEALRPLRQLLAGGDVLSPPHVRRALAGLPEVTLINGYGPTEGTTFTCCFPVADAERLEATVPIGRPIGNTRAYVLSPDLRPVPTGGWGELFAAGGGIGRGYLGHPDLTAERFVPDPFAGPGAEGSRLYRTGDVVRFRPDGRIEFRGRRDGQIKVRGFRVELGEIERALARHSEVRQAAVAAFDEGHAGRRLVGYVVPRPIETAGAADRSERGSQHVEQWRELYDQTYARGPAADADGDASFNIQGWNSSYTGEPIPAVEMREWLDGTVGRLLDLPHRRVLEVGCGTGLLLFRVAPEAERYRGTDFSAVALAQVRAELDRRRLPHVELAQGLADDWTSVRPGEFDLVVLNSVVQYFPGVEYLVQVLEGAVAAVAPGGAVFVGDVRSLPLLEAFHASVEIHRASGSLPVAELLRRVRRRTAEEEELVVDPDLFFALARRLPAVRRVQVLLKRGRHANELTRFRYDVILHVGGEDAVVGTPPAASLDWTAEGWSLAGLERHLQAEAPDLLKLRGIPNARLAGEAAALELLAGDGLDMETAEELRTAVGRRVRQRTPVDPEDLWAVADRRGYDADLTLAAGGGVDGRFDAVLRRRGAGIPAGVKAEAVEDLPWSVWANDPLRVDQARRLGADLRRFLESELPDYMVPSAFVVLDSLPLTPNGKVDRAALPRPERPGGSAAAWVAPATPLEELLATVATEVLGVERVGMADNFFDLGGHSLLATQFVSRLRQDHDLPVTLQMVFDSQTLADLADLVVRQEIESVSDELLGEALDVLEASIGERRPGAAERAGFEGQL